MIQIRFDRNNKAERRDEVNLTMDSDGFTGDRITAARSRTSESFVKHKPHNCAFHKFPSSFEGFDNIMPRISSDKVVENT